LIATRSYKGYPPATWFGDFNALNVTKVRTKIPFVQFDDTSIGTSGTSVTCSHDQTIEAI
jgi:hypothetical protein